MPTTYASNSDNAGITTSSASIVNNTRSMPIPKPKPGVSGPPNSSTKPLYRPPAQIVDCAPILGASLIISKIVCV